MKIKAKIKKWRENGGRLIEKGENPHSNGLWRFLSFKIFKDIKKPKKNKKNEIKTLKIILKNKIFIKRLNGIKPPLRKIRSPLITKVFYWFKLYSFNISALLTLQINTLNYKL